MENRPISVDDPGVVLIRLRNDAMAHIRLASFMLQTIADDIERSGGKMENANALRKIVTSGLKVVEASDHEYNELLRVSRARNERCPSCHMTSEQKILELGRCEDSWHADDDARIWGGKARVEQ